MDSLPPDFAKHTRAKTLSEKLAARHANGMSAQDVFEEFYTGLTRRQQAKAAVWQPGRHVPLKDQRLQVISVNEELQHVRLKRVRLSQIFSVDEAAAALDRTPKQVMNAIYHGQTIRGVTFIRL